MTVFVNAIMYYKVANATHAISNVDDFNGSARLLAATTLRNVLGTLTLGEILSQRESIAKEMRVMDNLYLHNYQKISNPSSVLNQFMLHLKIFLCENSI